MLDVKQEVYFMEVNFDALVRSTDVEQRHALQQLALRSESDVAQGRKRHLLVDQ